MDIEPISRETALKIALAARELPEVSVGSLMSILQERIDGALTEASLKGITVADLKMGLADTDLEEEALDIQVATAALKRAVQILWGESDEDSLPRPVASETPVAGVIRVAVASNEGEQLDGHFGSCIRFLVYDLSVDEYRLVDVRSTIDTELAEDKNAARTELIRDCQVLYVVSIGGPPAAKVVRAGIYPIKQKSGGTAQAAMTKLQQVLRGAPPPWLAKILGAAPEDRIRYANGVKG